MASPSSTTRGTWKIRTAGRTDAELLKALRRTAGWGEDEAEGWLADVDAGLRTLRIAFEDTADPGPAAAGMVALKRKDFDPEVADGRERAEVSSLAVAPEFARRGLARGLTELVEEVARAEGFVWMTLNTRPTN